LATQLVKLRYVTDDEIAELHALFAEHDIEVYETTAGSFGISMPAIWLKNDSQLVYAKQVLKEYEQERYTRVKAEYEELKATGQQRTVWDMIRENPLRYILYVGCIIGLLYISLVPFLSLWPVE